MMSESTLSPAAGGIPPHGQPLAHAPTRACRREKNMVTRCCSPTDRKFNSSTIETIIRPKGRPINGQQPQNLHGGPGPVGRGVHPVHLCQNAGKTAASLEQPRSLSENSVVGPRASGFFAWQRRRGRRCWFYRRRVGCRQAEERPLEARSNSPTGS